MRKFLKGLLLTAVVGLGLSGAVARANSLIYDFLDVTTTGHSTSNGNGVSVWLGGVNVYNGSTLKFNWTRSGVFNVANDWGGPFDQFDPKFGTNFDGFCIQLDQGAGDGLFEVRSLLNAPTLTGTPAQIAAKATALATLWGKHFGDTGTAQGTAGFQIAVWELVYETAAFDVTSGNFYATSSYIGTAATYLADALNPVNQLLFGNTNVRALVDHQDQLILTNASGPTIPLPASLWGGLAILGGLVVTRLASRKK